MRIRNAARIASSLCLVAPALVAQSPTAVQIPVRELAPPEAVSRDSVGYLYGVRELSDGRLLVNDAGARRLLLFDRSLQSAIVVADSGSGHGTSYGTRPTGIISYAGDTTLLVDLGARAFLVVSPDGRIVRVMSAPRPSDVSFMWNPGFGTPAFDPKGRLIYRAWLMPSMRGLMAGAGGEHGVASGVSGGSGSSGHGAAGGGGTNLTITPADSAPVLRADFDTRAVDTLAWVRIPRLRGTMTPIPGGMRMVPTINPLSTIDDWVALSDGSIAVLRGQDYHMEWIGADGVVTSSPKMPFDWKRLSREEKAAIVDSTRRQLERQGPLGVMGGGGSASAAAAASSPLPNPMMAMPHTMPVAPPPGAEREPPPRRLLPSDTARGVPGVVAPEEIPDYVPPILRPGNMKVDPQGNVWVLPSTSTAAGSGLRYDVIDRRGRIVQRVRLPIGRALAGFGANGTVYLTAHGSGGTRIERTRIK